MVKLTTFCRYFCKVRGITICIIWLFEIIRLTGNYQIFLNSSQNMSQTNRKTKGTVSTHRLLEELRNDLVYSARHRPRLFRKGSFRESLSSIYEQAKEAETSQRNLLKAAELYTEAARNGQKIDSCLKDFASIVHQMGQTSLAVSFLNEVRDYYFGDELKFDRLIATLQKQRRPSGKHHTRYLLAEMRGKVSSEVVGQMFDNTSRVKSIKCYNCLDFNPQNQSNEGCWLLLQFESFSGAKKTLEKFNLFSFFGVNLFWVRDGEIVCRATDGRDDFQGFVVNDSHVNEAYTRGRLWAEERTEGSELEVRNRVAIRLIENWKGKQNEWDSASKNLVWAD